jgi:hypothetical protein
VVCILPQEQPREDSITPINHAVNIATIRCLIVLSQGDEAVRWNACRRLRREVAE